MSDVMEGYKQTDVGVIPREWYLKNYITSRINLKRMQIHLKIQIT